MVNQFPLEDCTALVCPNGCVQIDYGVDDDASGALENAEIDGTEYVCHGAPGSSGEDGFEPDDIDECATDNGGCGENCQSLADTAGSLERTRPG